MSPTPGRPSGASATAPDWAAIARFLDGECPEAESARLRAWLADHPADAELLDALERRVGRSALAAPMPAVDVDAALRAVNRVRDKDPTRLSTWRGVPSVPAYRRWQVPALAAAAGLVLAAALYVMRDVAPPGAAEPELAARTYVTGVGERTPIALADGSAVTLGPESSLEVREYDAGARIVALRGEAHFVVEHDAERPFTVLAGGAAIVDLGTAFTVRASDLGTRVAVTDGVVEMRAGAATPGTGVVLRRGDVGAYDGGGRAEVWRGALAESDTAWMRGRLSFRDTPMGDVARELQRWYGVRMRFADAATARLRLTGAYDSREQALQGISAALGARLEVRGDTVVLHR
jgi:transmembrane sensor